jgi:hypothetical protein
VRGQGRRNLRVYCTAVKCSHGTVVNADTCLTTGPFAARIAYGVHALRAARCRGPAPTGGRISQTRLHESNSTRPGLGGSGGGASLDEPASTRRWAGRARRFPRAVRDPSEGARSCRARRTPRTTTMLRLPRSTCLSSRGGLGPIAMASWLRPSALDARDVRRRASCEMVCNANRDRPGRRVSSSWRATCAEPADEPSSTGDWHEAGPHHRGPRHA